MADNSGVPLNKLEVEQLIEVCNVEFLKYKKDNVPTDFLDTAAETFLQHVYRAAFLAGIKAYSDVVVQKKVA